MARLTKADIDQAAAARLISKREARQLLAALPRDAREEVLGPRLAKAKADQAERTRRADRIGACLTTCSDAMARIWTALEDGVMPVCASEHFTESELMGAFLLGLLDEVEYHSARELLDIYDWTPPTTGPTPES